MKNLLDIPDLERRTEYLFEAVLDGARHRSTDEIKLLAEQKNLIPVMTKPAFLRSFAFSTVTANLLAIGHIGRDGHGGLVKQTSPLCDLPEEIAVLIRPNLSTSAQPSGLVRGYESRPGRSDVETQSLRGIVADKNDINNPDNDS